MYLCPFVNYQLHITYNTFNNDEASITAMAFNLPPSSLYPYVPLMNLHVQTSALRRH